MEQGCPSLQGDVQFGTGCELKLNVLLVVPYNVFEAKHGNAIRVRALMETLLKNGNRISLLMYDLPGIKDISQMTGVKVYLKSVKISILIMTALIRLLFRASTFDLLCAKMKPFRGFGNLVKRIIEEDRIDVIQCENVWTVPPLVPVMPEIRKPIVITAHDVWTDRIEQLYEYQGVPTPISRRLLKSIRETETKAIKSCEACICVSWEDRKRLIEMGADPARTMVVPNGVDINKIRPVGKVKWLARELKIDDENVVLFFAGSEMFQNKKAAEDILKSILPKLDVRFRMVFAGTICRHLLKLNLPENVILAGYLKDLMPLYAIADIVILPITIGSGTKLKTIEAMAAGKAVITTPAGAVGLSGVERQCIWIEGDVEAFPSRIIELSQNRGLMYNMGKNSREKALEYDWGQLMNEYLFIYDYVKHAVLLGYEQIPTSESHIQEPSGSLLRRVQQVNISIYSIFSSLQTIFANGVIGVGRR